MMAAGWACSAINAHAMTVLPDPGGATSTPVGCDSMAATASCWETVSLPVNRAAIGVCLGNSAAISKAPPAARISAAASSRSPRGSLSHCGSVASKQQTRRGVFQVEKRWFCLR